MIVLKKVNLVEYITNRLIPYKNFDNNTFKRKTRNIVLRLKFNFWIEASQLIRSTLILCQNHSLSL